MEARNADGSWAGEDAGWTEGDKWCYSFDVMHDVPGLIEKRGGSEAFIQSLETHFNRGKSVIKGRNEIDWYVDKGYNDHTNEVRLTFVKRIFQQQRAICSSLLTTSHIFTRWRVRHQEHKSWSEKLP